MPYRETRIYSGAMMEIERTHCTALGKSLIRRSRGLPTGKAQAKINLKNARRRLMRLMCANFTRGDYHITLTFAESVSREAAGKELAKALRKLRGECRRAGAGDMRYICVREDRGVRPHYHLVCGAFEITLAKLQEIWPHGRVEMGTLDGNPDYGWLARYLTKQEEQDKGRKRWSQSKNLAEPYSPPAKILKRKALASRPAVPKGYYVMSAYRQATGQGYEWEYIIAIRQDRLQELPVEIQLRLEQSKTWGEFADYESTHSDTWH